LSVTQLKGAVINLEVKTGLCSQSRFELTGGQTLRRDPLKLSQGMAQRQTTLDSSRVVSAGDSGESFQEERIVRMLQILKRSSSESKHQRNIVYGGMG
jgi:hypothetical protein